MKDIEEVLAADPDAKKPDTDDGTKPGMDDDEDDFDFDDYFEDYDDEWDWDYYDEEDYDDEDEDEQEKEREAYAQHLRTFMDDFEPSDQLTTEIEPHATQAY